MQPVHNTLKFKLATSFLFFIVITSVISVWTSIGTMKSIATNLFVGNSLPITQRVASEIDPAAFSRLVSSLDEEDPYYTETWNMMYAEKVRMNCLYLYTMARTADEKSIETVSSALSRFTV